MTALPNDDQINGVIIKELKSFPDGRGFFREIFRNTEDVFTGGEFGQWSHSKMQKNVVKAWHYHHKQTDWWYIPFGKVKVALYDNREESSTYKTYLEFFLGDIEEYPDEVSSACVRIPPGVLHGCQVYSDLAHLFYITSHTYDPNDEGRIVWNSSEIPNSWPEEAIVSERDAVAFEPTATRVLI